MLTELGMILAELIIALGRLADEHDDDAVAVFVPEELSVSGGELVALNTDQQPKSNTSISSGPRISAFSSR